MSLPFPLTRSLWPRRHPSRLPYGALRAALTGPVGAANNSIPSTGNGRPCLVRFPIRALISLPLVGPERSGKPDISLATKTGHFHVLITAPVCLWLPVSDGYRRSGAGGTWRDTSRACAQGTKARQRNGGGIGCAGGPRVLPVILRSARRPLSRSHGRRERGHVFNSMRCFHFCVNRGFPGSESPFALRDPPSRHSSPSHKHRQSNYSCKKDNTGRFGTIADYDRIYPYLESHVGRQAQWTAQHEVRFPRPENRIHRGLLETRINGAVRHFPCKFIRDWHIDDAEPVARIRFSQNGSRKVERVLEFWPPRKRNNGIRIGDSLSPEPGSTVEGLEIVR